MDPDRESKKSGDGWANQCPARATRGWSYYPTSTSQSLSPAVWRRVEEALSGLFFSLLPGPVSLARARHETSEQPGKEHGPGENAATPTLLLPSLLLLRSRKREGTASWIHRRGSSLLAQRAEWRQHPATFPRWVAHILCSPLPLPNQQRRNLPAVRTKWAILATSFLPPKSTSQDG